VKVTIYIEGGGDSKDLKIRCRQGFHKLVEQAGFPERRLRFIPCGGRDTAFESFKTALKAREPTDFPVLLVDSEDPIAENTTSWNHLRTRDNWVRPQHVSDDQAQLMVTCMETWIMADRVALRNVFGAELQESALLPEANLEQYDRHRVQDALERATHNCGKNKAYKKGKRSFRVLEAVNPNTLKQRLSHFKRFIETLEKLLR